MMLGVGIPAGVLLSVVLPEGDRKDRFEKWCIWFGAVSLLFAVVIKLLEIDVVPVKGVVVALFVGLPAFSAGLVLLVARTVRREGNGI
ncbi:MAG: hypothetical protein H6955_11035 [Chromatiaceae bacterium]|nr:hypothetical protein [Chromatiaceae bacterium]